VLGEVELGEPVIAVRRLLKSWATRPRAGDGLHLLGCRQLLFEGDPIGFRPAPLADVSTMLSTAGGRPGR